MTYMCFIFRFQPNWTDTCKITNMRAGGESCGHATVCGVRNDSVPSLKNATLPYDEQLFVVVCSAVRHCWRVYCLHCMLQPLTKLVNKIMVQTNQSQNIQKVTVWRQQAKKKGRCHFLMTLSDQHRVDLFGDPDSLLAVSVEVVTHVEAPTNDEIAKQCPFWAIAIPWPLKIVRRICCVVLLINPNWSGCWNNVGGALIHVMTIQNAEVTCAIICSFPTPKLSGYWFGIDWKIHESQSDSNACQHHHARSLAILKTKSNGNRNIKPKYEHNM